MAHVYGLSEAVCLELPLRVIDVHKALDAVGGSDRIAREVSSAALMGEHEPLELRLRTDPFQHPIPSLPVRSNGLVVQISVPYRFRLGKTLKKSLTLAKAAGCEPSITPKFVVSVTHRFRAVADFQYYTGDSPFVQQIKKSLFTGDLNQICNLSLRDQSGASDTDVLPPPRFSVSVQPFYYAYQQSPYIKTVSDQSGESRLVSTVSSAKVISSLLTWGEKAPTGPPAGLSASPKPNIQECINALRKLFSERPSYTRRALQYRLGHVLSRQLKFSLPYVSYYYKSGPWRGAYVRYGVDPAQDSSMARYQVEHFRISSDESQKKLGTTTDIRDPSFDGTAYPDVPMLQLFDIHDGFLEPYIGTETLRPEVDENDGWYPADVIQVIRKVLRAELLTLNRSKKALTSAEKAALVDSIEIGEKKTGKKH